MLQPTTELDRLLLVGDDPASSDAIATHLRRHGFLVVGQVRSAEAARTAARYTDPDVVLVDAAVHDGWRAVVAALTGVMDQAHIAVLASYWSSDERRAANATGIGGVFLKSVEGDSLAGRLRAIAAHS
jgi:DNA-binding NarL/FixJ family response regulator